MILGRYPLGIMRNFEGKKKGGGGRCFEKKSLLEGPLPFFNMLHHLQGIGRFHLIMCTPYPLEKNPPKVYNCRNDFNKARIARLTSREKKPNKNTHTHTHTHIHTHTYVHTYTLEIGIVLFCFQASS